MADLFNNPSNDYVNPGLAPCATAADDSYFGFVDGGVGIIEGSNIKAKMDFSSLKIPVDAWSQQSKILESGEVAYIPGLTKGLCYKRQGFSFPTNLVSTDESLNPYFMKIDLSINYYNNFQFTYKNVEASSNYSQNVEIDAALSIAFNSLGIKVNSTYDPSILSFKGKQAGYDYTISNVKLTLIDASQNSSSPFPPIIIDGQRTDIVYDLVEDASDFTPFAKYPNGADQGVVVRTTYPNDSNILDQDKWFYLNHVTDIVTVCQEVSINSFVSNVSDNLQVGFDPSTSLGIMKPDYDVSFGIPDVSLVYSILISPKDISADASINGQFVDSSIISNLNIYDSSINDSSIYYVNLVDSSVGNSNVDDSFFENGSVIDISIKNSGLYETNISGGSITTSNLYGDVSIGISANLVTLSDSSISNYVITNSVLSNNYVIDSSASGLDASNNIFTLTGISESQIYNSDLMVCSIYDTSIWDSYINLGTTVNNVEIWDSSIINTRATNIIIHSGYYEDGSIYTSIVSNIYTNNVAIGDSTVIGISTKESFIGECNVSDSSITGGSIINNTSIITNSFIENSWTNTYRLLVYEDPSTLVKEYQYIMNDDTLDIDTSLARVTIQSSEIWDSSINNAELIDCSIYSCYLEDVSLSGCTVYNTNIDPSLYVSTLDDNRIILIDPSIRCSIEITYDSSTFYTKTSKRLNVGINGCSFDNFMSGGDYLQYITDNKQWRKVGDMYMWTSAPDDDQCVTKNLIDGFYIYNPHTFPIKVDYLIFV